MPHYADGTEAKVGDQVVGKLYNSGPAPKAGVIISITPGAESCNAMVQFTEATPCLVDADGVREGVEGVPRMALREGVAHSPVERIVLGANHGSSGARFALFTCADYCAVNELTKVG